MYVMYVSSSELKLRTDYLARSMHLSYIMILDPNRKSRHMNFLISFLVS